LAFEAPKASPAQQVDVENSVTFWIDEYPLMDPKVRSSSFADIANVLHVFNSGVVRLLAGAETTVSPSVLEDGDWLLINTPVSSMGASWAFSGAGWRYLVQRYVLQRHATENSALTVIVSDEFQRQFNSHDAVYLAECRSHRGCMLVASQSVHSFYGA